MSCEWPEGSNGPIASAVEFLFEPAMQRILIIEDEDKLREAMRRGLEEHGYEVVATGDGEVAWQQTTMDSFDCLVLDRMLPGRDGLQLLRDLRAAGNRTPALMVTALSDVENRVEGLDAGADDYVTKPFAWVEFLARLRSCIRRAEPAVAGVLLGRTFKLDCVHRKLLSELETVDLTDRECELLEYLMRRPGTTVTREALAREVWREPELNLTNIIDVYVGRLRKRLERVGQHDRIKTVRGSGYCFEE